MFIVIFFISTANATFVISSKYKCFKSILSVDIWYELKVSKVLSNNN